MNKRSLSACDPNVNVFRRSPHGFVYVAGNDSMPGLYKVGFTSEHPQMRITDLSAKSGCPTPFVLLAYFGCDQPRLVEGYIHEKLEEFRVVNIREFFRVSPSVLKSVFHEVATEMGDAFYSKGLDVFCDYLDQPEVADEDGSI
jgi:hypothetical protein